MQFQSKEVELTVSELDQIAGGQVAGSHHLTGGTKLKQSERSSPPQLLLHCATGQHIKEATLTC